MASRPVKPSAVYKDDKSGCGLLSLTMTVVCLAIVIALGVFAYFSPLFDSFRAQQAPQAEEQVEPIQDPTAPIEYEFYEVLPEQDFRSIPQGVSTQDTPTAPTDTLSPDAVVAAKPVAKSAQAASDDASSDNTIAVTEEDSTYDGDDTTDTKGDEAVSGTTYILQIRSYTTADEADVKRAEVLMAGVDAVVVKRTDSSNGTHFYQVVSTPMKSREEASQASIRLSNNGIDSLIVEQKR